MEFGSNRVLRRLYPYLLCVLITLAVIFCLVAPGERVFDMDHRLYDSVDVRSFDDGWYLIGAGGAVELLSLPAVVPVRAGETVALEKTLPTELPDEATVSFPTVSQTVYAYLDGELIYVWDDADTRAFGKAAPDTWNFVELAGAAGGETLRLELTSPYRTASGAVPSFSIGDGMDLKLAVVLEKLPKFVFCAGLAIVGASMAIVTSILSRRRTVYRSMRYISVFTVMVGAGLLCSMNIPQITFINDSLGELLSYTLMMQIPIPLVMYVKTRTRVYGQRALDVLYCAFVLNFLISWALQLADVVDLRQSLVATHLLLLALGTVMTAAYARGIKDGYLSLRVPEPYGLAVLILSALTEVVNFYLPGGPAMGNYLLVGLSAFIISLVATIVIEADRTTRQRESLIREVQEGRMRLMSSQIQPHFVFNTLAAIRAQISVDPEQAKKTVYSFAKHLRANIDSLSSSGLIAFTSEVDNVRAYTDIEKLRYGDYLTVRYDLRCTAFDLPPLTVQPLVENAVRHGVSKKKEGGAVTISAFETQDAYKIRVEDDGEGFDTAVLAGPRTGGVSTGIDNVRYRLRVMLGATLVISSVPGRGTAAEITIPKHAKKGGLQNADDIG